MLEESETIGHDLLSIAHGLFSTRRRSRTTNKDEPTMNRYGSILYIILRKHVDYLQEKVLKIIGYQWNNPTFGVIHHNTIDNTDKIVGFTGLDNRRIVSVEILFQYGCTISKEWASSSRSSMSSRLCLYLRPCFYIACQIGAKILNRLMFAALKHLSDHYKFENMRVFGFNDYADRGALSLLRSALRKQEHVIVTSKHDLFNGAGGAQGLYEVTNIPQARVLC